MFGRGFLLEDPLTLVRLRSEDGAKAQRQLAAAVRLARYKAISWRAIGAALGMSAADAGGGSETNDEPAENVVDPSPMWARR